VCVREKSMVGGGAWRYRVWSKAVGRVSGLVARGEAGCYPERANNFGTSDLAGKAQDV
jgi:hypothetical protein